MLSQNLQQFLTVLRNDERSLSTDEHAVMLVLIAIAVAAFVLGFAGSVMSVFS